ncbi:sensor histidine kinase [Saccharopolyspora rosea]|uniref:histidine kinase n=1 Tax=Saccharopolyspora rosea TaxID=524884 RepID=A0ABW3FMB6_9PSEU
MSRRLVPSAVDAVLAVLLTVFVVAATLGPARWYAHEPHFVPAVGVVLLMAGTLVLAWRRSAPLTTLLVSAGALVGYYALGFPGGPNVLGPALALGTYAFLRGPSRAAAVGAALVAFDVLVDVVGTGRADHALGLGGALLLGGVAAVAVGSAFRARAASLAAARKEAAEADQRRAEQERLAIAREVHDVVAHSLAMISVQAGVGSHVADKRPDQAKRALLEIKEASRTALEDLRRTLALLRGSGDLAPAPGLDRLADLVSTGRNAGLEVAVDGSLGPLPRHVDAAAYRILQESLTNVVRHAVGARAVTLRLRREEDGVELVVSDDGRPSGTEPGTGTGLRGMAERARVLGGWVASGPRPGGGFEVRAWLPLTGGDG